MKSSGWNYRRPYALRMQDPVLDVITTLKRLQYITITHMDLDFDAIRLLGEMADLTVCRRITHWDDFREEHLAQLEANSGRWFQNLREVDIVTSTWDNVQRLLRSISGSLRCLSATVTRSGMMTRHDNQALVQDVCCNSYRNFFQVLVNHPSVLFLTTLQLFSQSADFTWEPGTDVSGVFKTLYALKNLVTLEMQFRCISELDDDWLAGAAPSWTHLQVLKLMQGDARPTMTLKGLLPLVRHCHDLERLAISIIAEFFHPDCLPGGMGTRLESVTFYSSPIRSMLAVFRCLLVMFPRLIIVHGTGFDNLEETMRWLEISQLLEDSYTA
ncbi:hypothetical protein DXG01_016737 [Tephrocybe rancida]|nr:hypothetical protein DXG01_016737 [Tephrocybe rancida]